MANDFDDLGGKIVDQDFTVCGEDSCEGTCTAKSKPPDKTFINLPVCLVKVCADDSNYMDLLLLRFRRLERRRRIYP